MVLVQFEIFLHCLYWFGLVWRSVCKKGKCWVFKGNAVKYLLKDACSCFGYRLSYNYSNDVILIGKEP